ncbi:hypothetical protein SCHPADRAFT_664030 [Schizopora paradoxa]|uniref:Uncharacterized protein n=1 Tax=Schizopora paradoxa TaxID=27342 RepID=A0A0H2R5K4_9AGAM|nr:hypothetical protein SCHPADRAFT_664030 [Schizopora paradoxa]
MTNQSRSMFAQVTLPSSTKLNKCFGYHLINFQISCSGGSLTPLEPRISTFYPPRNQSWFYVARHASSATMRHTLFHTRASRNSPTNPPQIPITPPTICLKILSLLTISPRGSVIPDDYDRHTTRILLQLDVQASRQVASYTYFFEQTPAHGLFGDAKIQ